MAKEIGLNKENKVILIIISLLFALIFIPFYKYNFASPWTDSEYYAKCAKYYLGSWIGFSGAVSLFAYFLNIRFEVFTRALIISYLILLIFAPPLYFDIHLYSCFDISKVTAIYLLVTVVATVWIIRSVYLGKFEISIPPLIIFIPTTLWLLVTITSTIFSINPWMAFVGTYKRYEGLLVLINYFIIFYAILFFVPKERLYWFFLSIVLVGCISSVYGVIQFLELDPLKWESFTRYRIISFFGNPVFIAAYLSMAIFIILSMYIYTAEKKEVIKGKKSRETFSFKKTSLLLFYGASLVFTYISFCFTNTRATFVGLSVCTLVWVLAFYGLRFFLLYFITTGGLWAVVFYVVYQWLNPYSNQALFLGGLSLGLIFFSHLIITGIIKREEGVAYKIGLPLMGVILITWTVILNLDPPISSALRFFTMIQKTKVVQFEEKPIEIIDDLSKERKEQTIKERFIKIRDKLAGSAGWRIWMWTTGCAIIPDYWLTGIGADTLGIIFPKYLRKVYEKRMEGMLEMEDRLHNEIFDTGVSRGIPGLIIYFWLIFAFTLYCFRGFKAAASERKVLILGIYCAWLAYLVQNQFSFGNTPIACTYWILMAMAVKEIGPVKNIQISFRRNNPIFWVVYLSVIILGICFAIFVIRPYLADLHYKNGTVASAFGQWNKVFSEYKKAISLNYKEIRYWEELNRAYINYAITTGNREIIKEAINGAEILNKLLRRKSNTAYFTLGMAHFMMGDMDKAEEYYKKAIEWQPFIADIHNNLGIIYLNQGKTALAMKALEEAIEIRPEHSRSLSHLIRLYEENNEIDRAVLFLSRLANVLFGDEKIKILNILAWMYYHKKGDCIKSIEVSKRALEIDPNNADSHRNVALCSFRLKDYEGARKHFLEVLRINPTDRQAREMLSILR